MHPGSQALEIGIGHQLRVGGRLNAFSSYSASFEAISEPPIVIGKVCVTAALLLSNTSTKRSAIAPSFFQ
jgi:hypothetical protein